MGTIMRTFLPILLLFAPTLFAQQAAPANDDHALIQQLLQRVRDLEEQVRVLKTGNVAPPAQPAGPAISSTQAAAPQQQPAAPAPAPTSTAADMMHDMNLGGGMPTMQFRGFSDIRYSAYDHNAAPNTFGLGQFNLFITSKLSDKFSVLGEVVVEAGDDNVIGLDLERLLFTYSANDHFNIAAGRYHTAIGFYNTAYHHSTWLQTTVDRPFLFAFEDEGGVLPIHNVGLTANGAIPSGKLGLHYIAEVGNGRASRSPLDEPVLNVQDENNGKSVNFGLYARPSSVHGLQAGFSVYRDTLHPDVFGIRHIGQTIWAGHVIYQTPKFEFMNEALVLRHAIDGGPTVSTPGFYSQISRAFGKLRPYFRYEYINAPRREPLFTDIGLMHGPVTGIRYDFADFAAFKVEYNRVMRRDFGAINGLRTQVSFTF
jgi:hypothetical protein